MHSTYRHLATICLLVAAPLAISAEPEKAINDFTSEFVDCAAYYSIGAEGARRGNHQQSAERADQASQRAIQIASLFSEPETVAARMQLYLKDQASLIKNDYANLSVLMVRYGDSCKVALENPRARLIFWLAEH
jgi:hypothetical protein